MPELYGAAQGVRPTSGPYAGMSANDIIERMARQGYTQDGVNIVYAMRGLGNPPTVPASLAGQALTTTRFGPTMNGRLLGGTDRQFLNTFQGAAVDPFRSYDVGNWLGVAGMLAGAAGAAGLFNPAAAGGGAAGGAAGAAGAAEAGGTAAGAGLPEIVVTGTAPGVTAGQVGAVGAGAAGNYGDYGGWNATSDPLATFGNTATSNAGTLANSGAITGGAGTGVPNWLSGASNAFGGGGGSMWDDLIPLAGQLLGSWMEGRGAKDASQAQVAAALAGIDEQRRQYDTSRADQMPWLEAGRGALNRLQDPNAFTTSPGYEFVRREGNRDINNSFAARGGALSGNALRALDQYNTGLASQEYNNWFNQNASIAGIGQASAQNLAGIGQNNANNVSNLLTNQGNARASGILGQTDAYTNGLNQVGQWYGNYRRNRQGAF